MIAGVGLYALLAHTVHTRRFELAVRSALGARPAHLSRLVWQEAFALTLAASVTGLLVALMAARVPAVQGLRSLDVSARGVDVLALGAVVGVLLAVAALASLKPTLRAARTAPATVLRHD